MTGKLLDTTVLIDLSRGNTDAADFIDAVRASGTPLFISVISAMELIVGCRDKGEVEKAEKLTDERLDVLQRGHGADGGAGHLPVGRGGTGAGEGRHAAAPDERPRILRNSFGVPRILKLARTIADLARNKPIETAHLAEAIQYRPRRTV
jgi:hypothetical protein